MTTKERRAYYRRLWNLVAVGLVIGVSIGVYLTGGGVTALGVYLSGLLMGVMLVVALDEARQ